MGIENTEDCGFKDLRGSMGNTKILKKNDKAFSGILIAPLKRPRALKCFTKDDGSARMANFAMSLLPAQFGPQRLANYPVPSLGVRNQLVIFGREAPSCCKFLLFRSGCATVVQPEGYNGLKYATLSHTTMFRPPVSSSAGFGSSSIENGRISACDPESQHLD